MAPTLDDGDFVLVVPVRPRVGCIVVVAHRELGSIVKRIVARDEAGWLHLEGDNRTLSIASHHIGPVRADAVRGTAWLRFPARGGVVRLGVGTGIAR